MTLRDYKAHFGLAIKIYSVKIFILNNSVIRLINMKPQNKQICCQISPRGLCNPCGYTMKMSPRYHGILIFDVKRTTTTEGMGPFNDFCF